MSNLDPIAEVADVLNTEKEAMGRLPYTKKRATKRVALIAVAVGAHLRVRPPSLPTAFPVCRFTSHVCRLFSFQQHHLLHPRDLPHLNPININP